MKKCHIVIGFNEENPEGVALAIKADRGDAIEVFDKAKSDKSYDFVGYCRGFRWEKRSKPAEDADRAAEREKVLKNAAKLADEAQGKKDEPNKAPADPDAEAALEAEAEAEQAKADAEAEAALEAEIAAEQAKTEEAEKAEAEKAKSKPDKAKK